MGFKLDINKIPSWIMGLSLLGMLILFALSYFEKSPFKFFDKEFGFYENKEHSESFSIQRKELLNKISSLGKEIRSLKDSLKTNKQAFNNNIERINNLDDSIKKETLSLHNEINDVRKFLNNNKESITNIHNTLSSIEHTLMNKVDDALYKQEISHSIVKDEIHSKIALSFALSYQIQGVYLSGEKFYLDALESFTNALLLQVGNIDQQNLHRNKYNLLICLNKLKISELKENQRIVDLLQSLLTRMKEYSFDGRHEDFMNVVTSKLEKL